MEILWKSADGYVRVVREVYWPPRMDPSDLEALFRDGAWVVVFWNEERAEWRATRSRRLSEPNLLLLRRDLPEDIREDWFAASSVRTMHTGPYADMDVDDVIVFAQALYRAWGRLAAQRLPLKLERMGIHPDEFRMEQISAWLRPGIPLYRAMRQELGREG